MSTEQPESEPREQAQAAEARPGLPTGSPLPQKKDPDKRDPAGGASGARYGLFALPGRLARRSGEIIRGAALSLRNYLLALGESPSTRRLTVLWGVCFIFLGISFLSSSNPFRLLWPGAAFPLPVEDERRVVKIFGLSDDGVAIVPVERRMSSLSSPPQNLRQIAFLISRPLGLREKGARLYSSLAPLPELGLAIRRVWFTGKQGGGGENLIIDLRRRTLTQEITRFHKNRLKPSRTAKKESGNIRELDGYFRALTASIFSNFPTVRSLRYLLDGERAAYPGMEFDLTAEYGRDFSPRTAEEPKKQR